MTRRILLAALGLSMTVLSAPAQAQQVTLTVSHWLPPTHALRTQALDRQMPAPVPRFDRTVPIVRESRPYSNSDILNDYGIPDDISADLISKGIL